MIFTNEQLNAFVNALQVCIIHEMHYRYIPLKDTILMSFTSTEINDDNLGKFKRLVPGEIRKLGKYSHQYWIKNLQQLNLGLLTHFLLLTRLQDNQIIALVKQDMRFRPYAKILGLLPTETDAMPVVSLTQARDLIFQTIEKKSVSLATLAQQTGLSQVSLNNFKAGRDIRLSNLLKIAKALGIKVTLS